MYYRQNARIMYATQIQSTVRPIYIFISYQRHENEFGYKIKSLKKLPFYKYTYLYYMHPPCFYMLSVTFFFLRHRCKYNLIIHNTTNLCLGKQKQLIPNNNWLFCLRNFSCTRVWVYVCVCVCVYISIWYFIAEEKKLSSFYETNIYIYIYWYVS